MYLPERHDLVDWWDVQNPSYVLIPDVLQPRYPNIRTEYPRLCGENIPLVATPPSQSNQYIVTVRVVTDHDQLPLMLLFSVLCHNRQAHLLTSTN